MRRRGPTPKKEPPDPPDPECVVCGTYDCVTNSPPLCEEHDSEIRRERFQLQRRAQHLAEKKVDVECELEGFRGREGLSTNDRYQRLTAKRKKLGEKLSRVDEQLDALKDKCDHENLQVQRREYDAEDMSMVPDDEMPDELPVVEERRKCPECGLRETETIQGY